MSYDRATGKTTAVVLHLNRGWTTKRDDEMPRCGETSFHPGYVTACTTAEAVDLAKHEGLILCGACVFARYQ